MTLTDIKNYFITVGLKKGEASARVRTLSLDSILKAYTQLEIIPNLPPVPTPPVVNIPTIDELLPGQYEQDGKFLSTSNETISWQLPLPAQAGQTGKLLSTDGTAAAWVTVPIVPDQSSNSGKLLTTNGTELSWGSFMGLPSQSGSASKYLVTNGTDASWTTLILNTWANDAARPINPVSGTIGLNLTSNKVECFIVDSWIQLH